MKNKTNKKFNWVPLAVLGGFAAISPLAIWPTVDIAIRKLNNEYAGFIYKLNPSEEEKVEQGKNIDTVNKYGESIDKPALVVDYENFYDNTNNSIEVKVVRFALDFKFENIINWQNEIVKTNTTFRVIETEINILGEGTKTVYKVETLDKVLKSVVPIEKTMENPNGYNANAFILKDLNNATTIK